MILSFFFNSIQIPHAVALEFSQKWNIADINTFTIIKQSEQELNLFLTKYPSIVNLGNDDRAVLSLATLNTSLVITDDKQVRNFCLSAQIPVIGTLRLLKNGYLSLYYKSKAEYYSVIDIISHDLYLSKDLINWAKNVD